MKNDEVEYKSMVDYIRETDLISLFEPISAFFKGINQGSKESNIKSKQTIQMMEEKYRKGRIEDLQYESALLDYMGKYQMLQKERPKIEKPKIRKPMINLSYKVYN